MSKMSFQKQGKLAEKNKRVHGDGSVEEIQP